MDLRKTPGPDDVPAPAPPVINSDAAMVTALVRLHTSLQDLAMPLDLPGIEEHRATRADMIDQLEDYVIPRVMTLEAPLLVVVGGSTGAGKSTDRKSVV